MDWYHKSSVEWLEARTNYLTSSDIAAVLPFTPTGKSRSINEQRKAALKIWEKKLKPANERDAVSYDEMGRGHWLEKYAVDEYNEQKLSDTQYHWDNILIHHDGISYSPDALNIEMPVNKTVVEIEADNLLPTELLEIKSYGIVNHNHAIEMKKESHLERWQLATAMYVSPSIQIATLMFYNPEDVYHPICLKPFTRRDLEKELETIKLTKQNYDTFVDDFNVSRQYNALGVSPKLLYSMSDIEAEVTIEQETNKGILNL